MTTPERTTDHHGRAARRRRVVVAYTSALLVVAGLLLAPGAATAAEGTGTISGRVMDRAGAPVVAATVWATVGSERTWAMTAPDGSFTVTTAAGAALLTFRPSHWSGLGQEHYQDASTLSAATLITVAAGQVVTGVDAVLDPAATISGTVRGPGGPVALEVWAYTRDGWVSSALSDATGRFAITVPAGATTLCAFTDVLVFECLSQWNHYTDADYVTVAPGQLLGGVDMELGTVRPVHFTDVATTDLFAREIYSLQGTGVTTGYADGTFRPAEIVTRQAMAAYLYRLAGSPAYTPPSQSPIRDVATTHGFYKEITWAVSQGLMTVEATTSGSYFKATDRVSRQATAAILYRLAGSPTYTPPATSPFSDVSTTHMFYKEIAWMSATGISTGWVMGSTAEFRPSEQVPRSTMAAFLVRARDRAFVVVR